MSEYLTKQRKLLIQYFTDHIDEPISARQIVAALAKENISLSAVYRNLSALEKDGKLQRVNKKDSRNAYYRYMAFDECRNSLHLSCKKCGKTFHLNSNGVNTIVNTLHNTESFLLDISDTVLYGVCGECKSKK